MPRPTTKCRVLIIECNPARLREQGITLRDEFEEVARRCPSARLHVIEAHTAAELRRKVAGLKYEYHMVVLVGHANVEVLGFADGDSATWTEVGQYLRPVNPETVLIAGCEAGRTLATRHLFDELPDLFEVFGAGGPVTADQIRALKYLLQILVEQPEVGDDLLHILQLVAAVATGATIFWQTEDGYESSDDGQDVVWDTWERVLQKLVARLFQR